MTDTSLHSRSLVIDALQCSDFNRDILLEAQQGGVTAQPRLIIRVKSDIAV